MLQKVLKWLYGVEGSVDRWAAGNARKGAGHILDFFEWVLVQLKEALVG